jgi:MoxR-like ATPase
VLSYDALADGVPADHIVKRIVQTVPLPQVAPRQRAGGFGPGTPGGPQVPVYSAPQGPYGVPGPGPVGPGPYSPEAQTGPVPGPQAPGQQGGPAGNGFPHGPQGA